MENSRDEYPEEVEKISHDMYVDDLITGDTNVERVKHLKETAIDIFQKADFELHKWHSNVPELESEVKPSVLLNSSLELEMMKPNCWAYSGIRQKIP